MPTFMYMYVCIYVCIYIYIYIQYIYMCVYVYIYVCVYVCVLVMRGSGFFPTRGSAFMKLFGPPQPAPHHCIYFYNPPRTRDH